MAMWSTIFWRKQLPPRRSTRTRISNRVGQGRDASRSDRELPVYDSQVSLKLLFLLVTFLALPLAAVAQVSYWQKIQEADARRHLQQNSATLQQLVMDVEAIRRQLSRVPSSQFELEQRLGNALPVLRTSGEPPARLHFIPTSQDAYLLQTVLTSRHRWVYDSTTPTAGWTLHGP